MIPMRGKTLGLGLGDRQEAPANLACAGSEGKDMRWDREGQSRSMGWGDALRANDQAPETLPLHTK